MITSTGNNFGAGQITLKDFQNEKVLVLNGKFTFNNKSEAFKAATVLEIYVPTLSIPKSGMSGCYIQFNVDGRLSGTTIKHEGKIKVRYCYSPKFTDGKIRAHQFLGTH